MKAPTRQQSRGGKSGRPRSPRYGTGRQAHAGNPSTASRKPSRGPDSGHRPRRVFAWGPYRAPRAGSARRSAMLKVDESRVAARTEEAESLLAQFAELTEY